MLLCWVDNSIPGRPFFKEENQGLLDCKLFFSESTDNGESWSEPQYITWGKGWQYFKGMDVPHCRKEVTFVCYESLRSIKQAADMAGLNEDDIKDIFFNNAKDFFGLQDN